MGERVWIISPNGAPHAGYYRARLYKGCPLVPIALIAHEDRDADGELQSDTWYELLIDREFRDWTRQEPMVGEPIDLAEYNHLCQCREYDKLYVPAMAEARKPVDLLEIGRLF